MEKMLAMLFFLMYLSSKVGSQLSSDFYTGKCLVNVQSIIQEEVRKAFFLDRGVAPGLLRLHFHDCFVKGCDGSILIKSTPGNSAEEDGPPNAGTLRGIQVIENAKARLERQCPGVVSCADILAYAARDSVVITGGFGWNVAGGRRDGRISRASDTIDIPAPFFNLDQLTQSFAKKNLTQDEMIALSGAHTIGRAHCRSFADRLYNFNSSNGQDPSLARLYALFLKRRCPRRPNGTVDPNLVVNMNLTPDTFGNSYYIDVDHHRGLFTSDQALTSTPDSSAEVDEYIRSNRQWLQDFADAMVKMSQIEVLTGTAGEIRKNCRVVN